MEQAYWRQNTDTSWYLRTEEGRTKLSVAYVPPFLNHEPRGFEIWFRDQKGGTIEGYYTKRQLVGRLRQIGHPLDLRHPGNQVERTLATYVRK
ncbi:MAG: hypothetical protein Q7R76_02755 [Candidatus Woesearchaeota archaeon]|nr:hypothetical protein [Candidatus Woesearchaeota archaeon]